MLDVNPYAEINLEKLRKNIDVIREIVKPNVKIMAIVKANAYGHGGVKVSKIANQMNIFHFGVATLNEGIELRENNIKGEILILGQISPDEIDLAIQYDLTITLSTIEFLENIKDSKQIKIHIKIDTGLSRYGFYMHHYENVPNIYNMINELILDKRVLINGLFTHFASSENNEISTIKQLNLFIALIDKIKESKINCGLIHTANSAAMLLYSESHFDMVRVGLLMYGVNKTEKKIDVQPIMTLLGTLVQVKQLKPGDNVGYGATYTSNREITLGIVNLGYADGINRKLSNVATFTLNNQKVDCVGRISMDCLTVLIPNINPSLYDRVVIFGDPSEFNTSVTELCNLLNTIEYEVFCSLGTRIKRKYT